MLEFRKFSAKWDFKQDISSPEFAQSNDMMKRTKQTVKRSLFKCIKTEDDKYLEKKTFLQQHQN